MSKNGARGLTCEIKVTLSGTDPAIWRRIVLSGGRTMGELHWAIQLSMGWENSHLHAFRIDRDGPLITDPGYELDHAEVVPEEEVTVAEVLPAKGSRIVYDYDFGDNWEHDVVVESIRVDPEAARSIRCVAGERACPLEDIGGVYGYREFLEAIADPEHEDHEHMLTWCDGPFDPAAFDPAEATRALRDPERRFDWLDGLDLFA